MLASAGSLAVEGSLVGWVANHRRHHVFSDKPGDPHSPHCTARASAASCRGFAHAHVGWLFKGDATSAERYAPDLLDDADTRIISRLFPFFAVFSLAAPFFLGWTLSGAIGGAFTALLWAGLARMMLLHHVTWSVNSICHMFGRQPATQKDHEHATSRRSGSSRSARRGTTSTTRTRRRRATARCRTRSIRRPRVIRLFERAGWATNVRWPTEAQLSLCRSD